MRASIVSPVRLLLALALALSAACAQAPSSSTPPAPRGAVVVIPTLQIPPPPEEAPDTQALERGLEFRLREGASQPTRPAPVGPAAALALPVTQTAALLRRLPPLPVEARDSFRFPLRSPPPPRTGATILAAFPPPDSVVPARPEPATEPEPAPPLEVARVTPTGDAQLVPEVIVSFSQPMVAIATVAALDAQAVPVRLSPQPAGRWSWIDTRTLRFEPTARLPMATRYVLEVPAGTRSATGAVLPAAFRAEFSTAPARAVGAFPNRGEAEAVPPPPVPLARRGRLPGGREYAPYAVTDLQPLVVVHFDQRVDRAALLPFLEMTVNGAERPLRLATAEEIAADSIVRRMVEAAPEERWIVVRPVERLPRDASVAIAVTSGAPSAEGPRPTEVTQELYFRTYGPLRVLSVDCAGPSEDVCYPGAPWSIAFTNPLDSASLSAGAVRVTPSLPDLAVDVVDGRVILRGTTRPRTRYTVTLDASIRDRFSQSLGAAETVIVEVGDAPPMLSLPGSPFIVLDPAGPPRVAVQSRGPATLRVRVYRVAPGDWAAFSEAVREHQQARSASVLRSPGQLVVDDTLSPGGATGDFAETAIDVSPALRDGLGHAVVIVDPLDAPVDGPTGAGRIDRFRSRTYAWVQSTRIGLAAMVDQDEVVGWATSLRDGEPLPGVQLALVAAGQGVDETVSRAVTGPAGTARLPLGTDIADMLFARLGDDTAILPESAQGWYGNGWAVRSPGGELRWLLFSDRGLYRPGEQARLKGWIRRADLSEGGALGLPGGVEGVRYTVQGPRQEEIASGTMTPGALGGFSTSIQLPPALNLGHASVQLEATGAAVPERGRNAYHGLQVQEFRRPEYEVRVEAEAGPHIVGGSIPAAVTASYYSGGGLAESRVEWRAVSTPGQFTPPGWDEWAFGRPVWWGNESRAEQQTLQGRTGPDGTHRVQLDLLRLDPPFPASLRLDAQVGDVNRQVGSGGANLIVHPAALYAGLRAERNWLQPGDSVGIEIVTVDIGGRVASGRGIELTAERVEWRWIPRTGRQVVTSSDTVTVCRVTTAAEPVRCVWRPQAGGSYRLRAEVRDDAGRVSRTELQSWVASDQAPPSPDQGDASAVTLLADRPEYQPGDTARIMVRSPLHPATGVVTIRQTGVTRTEPIRLDGATRELRIPITDAHVPNVLVRVDLVDTRFGTGFAAGQTNLSVPPRRRELSVEITPRDSVTAPGAATFVDLAVRGADGRPVAGAEVALWMVDESILSLGGYQLPDPLQLFYPQRYPEVRDLGLRPFVLVAPRSAGPGTVSATLVNAASGERLGGVAVVLEGTALQVITDASGAFTIRGVPAGRHTLVIEGPGATMRRAVEVPAEGVHLGTIILSDAMEEAEEVMMAPMPPPPPPPPGAPAPAVALEGVVAVGYATQARSGNVVGGAAEDKSQGADPVMPRTEFAPLALFEPSLRTAANGRVRVPVRLPQSLTRYRVMAVAVAGTDRFGRGESTVTTRRDLMVRPTAPRFLNFGDRVEIPIVLQNSTDRPLEVEVAARGNGLRLVDPQGQRVTVPAHDRVEVRFPAVADGAGTAQLQVVAVSGAASDAAVVSFPVYTPATAEAFATYGEIDTARPFILPVAVPDSVLPQFGGLEVTLSSTAIQELTDAVIYLCTYPYEGAEQIASRVLAIASLREVLTAFRAEGLPSPDSLVALVQSDLDRLAALQTAEGGWSWWRVDRPADPFVTIHVAHALQRAQENGFTVPPNVLGRALEYLRLRLPGQLAERNPRVRTALLAYSLYVRDRAGDPAAESEAVALVAAERAARPLDDMPLEPAGWLLHVLADEPGAAATAQELLRTIRNRATETAAHATFATGYGGEEELLLASARRSDAVVLEALIAADPTSSLVPKTVRGLLAHRTRGRWASTQENAWALVALQRYFRVYERVTPDFRGSAWLGTRFAGEHLFQGRTTERFHVEIPMAVVASADSTRPLTLARAGEGRMYYRAGLRYAPADLQLDALQRGFAVQRVYEAVDDSADVRRDQYGNWRVRAGARVRVRLTMTNPSRRVHVALMDPIPAGLEPINAALQGVGFTDDPAPRPRPGMPIAPPRPIFPGQWYIHQNLRDDRAEAFASFLPAGRHEFSYLARATTPGTFVVPPARAEEMYNPESFGRGATGRVIVE